MAPLLALVGLHLLATGRLSVAGGIATGLAALLGCIVVSAAADVWPLQRVVGHSQHWLS